MNADADVIEDRQESLTSNATDLASRSEQASQQPSPILVWVPIVMIVVLMAGMVRRAARPLIDPDSWWHLRVGELFWDGTFTLWETGPLSSFATEPWVPRDWLPQLVASKIEQWAGLPGVAWLYGASLIVLVAVLYLVSRAQSAPLVAALVTGLGIVGAAASTTERPQMVSFILLPLVAHAWLQTAKDGRPRWWVVPLTWVWACSHGLWFVGIGLGVVAVLGMVLDRTVHWRSGLRLMAVPIASLAVAALTPAGPTLLLGPLQTKDKWEFVTEWAPPDFTKWIPAVAMLMVCLVALTWARRRASASWVLIGLLLVGTAMVLMSARTVAAGAVILVPVLAATIQAALYGDAQPRLVRHERSTILAAAAGILIALGLITPHTSAIPGLVPNAVNSQLEALPAGTPILNEYGLGGWLHWRHPELNTVIDGFTDGYTVKDIEDYRSALAAKRGWKEYVEDKGVAVALIKEDSALAFALEDSLGWSKVGSDEDYVLLVAPSD